MKIVAAENDISIPKNQMRFVAACELYACKPVNREAVNVLYALEEWLELNRPDWRVAFEVAMGAFIKTRSREDAKAQDRAFSSYNSKRVDFLIIDKLGQPRLAVEYHGSGHDLSPDAPDRMMVKRLALARAGVPLVEIAEKSPRPEIMRLVSEKLGLAAAA